MRMTHVAQFVVASGYVLAQTDAEPAFDPTTVTLNAGGWLMMSVSILLVCGLSSFCLYRILREPTPSKEHHAPLEINTRDEA